MRNFSSLAVLCSFITVSLSAQTALIRHAPTLNGRVEGSIQQMTAESTTLNGGAEVTGDLLVPGLPTVRLNGNPTYAGTLDGSGAATPTTHTITLNGNTKLGHVVRRTDAVALPTVTAPPAPTGTRNVSLINANQSPGDFATLRNLTLNGGVAAVIVPPGTYGNFTANGNSSFVLGIAGATTPANYHFQGLTLNGNSTLTVVGPVNLTLNGTLSANGDLGSSAHPDWLNLNIVNGGLTLNGNVSVYARFTAPDGTLTINGNSEFVGSVVADRLTMNGNGLLRLIATAAPNQPPTIALTAPAQGTSFPAPAAITLSATASDSDGSVAKVEFYQGTTKLGEDTASPYQFMTGSIPAGSYTFSARAIDNLGASATSAAVTITVTAANQPPMVALTTPTAGGSFTAPATIALTATASDSDGTVAKVEFYSGPTKLGEDATAPYAFTASGLAAGNYTFTAQAFDQQGLAATSAFVTVTVGNPNQAPTVTLTAPSDGASFTAPASFTLTATAADTEGAVAKVEFFQGATKLGEDSTAPYEFAVTGLAAGAYSYRARATDNVGLSTDSAVRTVTVTAPNSPPTVAMTAPLEAATFTAPATITLRADASDSNDTVSKVEFFNGPTKLGEDALAPYEYLWVGVAVGSYTLTAVATDNSGARTTSAPRTVAVGVDRGVPFLANFEPSEGYTPGPLHGQNGWVVLGAANIVPSPVASGQQAVSIAPATTVSLIGRLFTNPDPRTTFVDLYAQPAAATPADGVFFETDVVRVALTGNATQGILQAFSGDNTIAGGGVWLPTPTGPALDATGHTTQWLRLTARADYATKRWDLYWDGKMVAADLGFYSITPTAFTSLGLSGHATQTTGFDDVLVAFENPLFVDADHDGMEDAWETAHGLNPAVNDRATDLDNDGLMNIQEYVLGTNPNAADTDGDGLPDKQELSLGTNPRNADTDGDGLPDGWEKSHNLNPLSPADATLDTDGDGIPNLAEYQAGTDPNDYYNSVAPQMTALIAGDGHLGADGLVSVRLRRPDGTPLANAPLYFFMGTANDEIARDLPPAEAAKIRALVEETPIIRTDSEGLAVIEVRSVLGRSLELSVMPVGATNALPLPVTVYPQGLDSDADGLPDLWENNYFGSLAALPGADPDQDGLTNLEELQRGTDPVKADTDGDQLSDGWELAHGTNPLVAEGVALLNADADGDGLDLVAEARAGTDPTKADTDGDGIRDGEEVRLGLNPLLDDANLDTDGDGIANLEEIRRGSDPQDYYNGREHQILPFIGDDTGLGANNLLAARVVAEDGTPLVNAPLIFTVDEGQQIARTPDGEPLGRTLEIRSGPGGIARAYIRSSAPQPSP